MWCLDSVTRGCTLLFGSVEGREGDSYSLVESFVVHLLFVGLAGPCYYRKHTLSVFSLVISPELNNRRHSLPKLELKDLSDLPYRKHTLPVILSLVASPG